MTVTPRGLDVLRALHQLRHELVREPTMREVGDRIDMATVANVRYHLQNLMDAGMLENEQLFCVTCGSITSSKLRLTPQGQARVA